MTVRINVWTAVDVIWVACNLYICLQKLIRKPILPIASNAN